MGNNKQNSKEQYLSAAKGDLIVCEQLNSVATKKQCNAICFHAQQAAEKYFKALWKDLEPTTKTNNTHDISYVIQEIENHFPVDNKLKDYAEKLTRYAVDCRYDFCEKISENEAEIAIIMSKKICKWVAEKLKEQTKNLSLKKTPKPKLVPKAKDPKTKTKNLSR